MIVNGVQKMESLWAIMIGWDCRGVCLRVIDRHVLYFVLYISVTALFLLLPSFLLFLLLLGCLQVNRGWLHKLDHFC